MGQHNQLTLYSLAKEVYSSDARFIFELLQNADDNKFTKAAMKNLVPGIRFILWPDKIIVECNEDGFTKQDLEAICSIGESSKTASYGSIGAKGIGFKSVFKVASRVHIQSGHFSFEFNYRQGDSASGMVRPVWKTPDQTLHGPMTRMTLWLNSKGDTVETNSHRDIIDRQFEDLDVACLLFLKNLRSISIETYDYGHGLVESRQITRSDPDGYRVALQMTTWKLGCETKRSRRTYHVTRQDTINLPQSSNKTLTPSVENLAMAQKAEVVLAFPLNEETPTEASRPITDESHHLFAFLPVKEDERYKVSRLVKSCSAVQSLVN